MAQNGQSQISLPKHKSIFQNTNQFTKTQNNFSKHKSVYQNTKQFLKTQTNFVETQISLPKHKSISQNTNQFRGNTNQKTGHLLCYYQRAWKGLIPRIFRVQHGDFKCAVDKSKMFWHNSGSEVLQEYFYCSQCGLGALVITSLSSGLRVSGSSSVAMTCNWFAARRRIVRVLGPVGLPNFTQHLKQDLTSLPTCHDTSQESKE